MWLRSRGPYNRIGEDENDYNSRPEEKQYLTFWPICSGFLLGVCLLLLFLLQRNTLCVYGEDFRQFGFENDFEAPTSEIEYQQIQFGGIVTTPGSFEISGGASSRSYVGTSYHEVDKAWNDILEERWFNVTFNEKRNAFGVRKSEEYLDFIQLDVFHLLHCINHLRKIIDADYYFPNGLPPIRIHTDHCLDVLRESIQCHADLTPIPYRLFKNSTYYYSDSIQEPIYNRPLQIGIGLTTEEQAASNMGCVPKKNTRYRSTDQNFEEAATYRFKQEAL